jgi:recombinational DNA repair ATPase RecF
VFLALSALDQPESTILVLDDVLSSVDEAHVARLLDMLHSEAQRFRHCIVTTCDRAWPQKLGTEWLRNASFQLVELGPWTLQHGIKWVPPGLRLL